MTATPESTAGAAPIAETIPAVPPASSTPGRATTWSRWR
jgi:hypothetical protein